MVRFGMVDAPIITEKDVFEQAGAGLVATLALAAANSGAPLPVQGAMLMAGSLLGLGIGRGFYNAAVRRYPLFATGFLSAFDPDRVRAGEKAKAAAEQPIAEDLDDTMMRSFRMMMDAADESVVPIVGYMAAVYIFGKQKPDAFFRGLGRLLCELEAGEIEQLKALLRLASAALKEAPEASLQINDDGQLVAHARGKRLYEPKMPVSALRLFMLLKREGLGGSQNQGGAQAGARPVQPDRWLKLDSIMVSRILEVVDPDWRSRQQKTDYVVEPSES